jgi:hypothetical protein
MSRSELQDFGSDQPIWRFVAEVGAERFTGEAELGVDPRVALFATEGHIYAAEVVDGPTIGQRLVQAGALTPEQLAKGAVHVGDTLSLARMFQREASIDRDQVELALEQMTEALLDSVSSYPVGQVTVRPLRHHPSGVHQWQPEPAPLTAERTDDTVAALVAAMSTVVDDQASVAGIAAVLPPPPPSAVAAAFPAPPAPPSPPAPVAAPALPTLGSVGAWVPPPETEREPTTEHRFAPQALDSQQLPKLMDRPMSMVEITAAHAVITGETPPPVEESVYAPIAVEGLPTLQGFAPLAAAAPAVVVEEPAVEAPVIVEDPGIVEPSVAEDAPAHDDAAAARDALHIPSFEALLDTPTTDWSTPAQPPAVQEIWDMVDDLLGLPHHDVTPGHAIADIPVAPPHIEAAVEPPAAEPDADANESKRHGWLRNRKG